jgi:hypothetical protein
MGVEKRHVPKGKNIIFGREGKEVFEPKYRPLVIFETITLHNEEVFTVLSDKVYS